MARLDHLQLPVHDWEASRDWWRDKLGFEVEFEVPERKTAAMRDSSGLTVFLNGNPPVPDCTGVSLTIQVEDVELQHAELAAQGVAFVHPPQKVYWGYGAELLDPNGYRLNLWDERTMREKG